jgi:hypothetical protein
MVERRNYIWLVQTTAVSVIVHLVPIHLEERVPHSSRVTISLSLA